LPKSATTPDDTKALPAMTLPHLLDLPDSPDGAPNFAIPAFDPADRRTFIGATDCAALFGLSPWKTAYKLWLLKAGLLAEPELDDDPRVQWGKRLETPIARGLAEDNGWEQILASQRVTPHPTVANMACTPDFEILDNPDDPGILEIKTVDRLTFLKHWPEATPPLNYYIQLQHQLACTGRRWGVIGVLVGGNEGRVYRYDRDEETIAQIEATVPAFWASIAAAQPPSPDFEKDAETVLKLWRKVTPGTVLETNDPHLLELCRLERKVARWLSTKTRLEKRQKALRAEILTLIHDAALVFAGSYQITSKEIAPVELAPSLRSGYRRLSIDQKVAQPQAA